ncbi:echinoderm microtubule-associated protein-like 1 isoform X5 [Tigriopus californicus]|uniref:echinoderm microtubule-associated protein-like 1 isoform X5 n=1 Tax=Tigriopus californicus TaxID=6832 RepID=UPI0027D9FB10|nr:echinoderm microtubule-associated protein-like 1 isoform X5 [Tigriopus californicus]
MAHFESFDDANLRTRAIRRSLGNINGPHRLLVTLDNSPDRKCPMHGGKMSSQYHHYQQQPHQYHQPHHHQYHNPQFNHHGGHHSDHNERMSRKEMARELRLSVAREEAARRSSSYTENSSRSFSLEPGYSSHSVPRRFSAAAATKTKNVERNGSFQDNKAVPRDVFKGKVDFKTILRRFDPKEEERSSSGGSYPNLSRTGMSSHSRDYYGSPRRGQVIETDFDFRACASSSTEPNWDNPGRFRNHSGHSGHSSQEASFRSISPRQVRPLTLQLDLDSGHHGARSGTHNLRRAESTPISPRRGYESNPISPRRVEFGDEIIFDFNPSQRPEVVSPTHSSKAYFKPILRHTTSDPSTKTPPLERKGNLMEQFERKMMNQKHEDSMVSLSPLTIQHANPEPEITSPKKESLVQIYIPSLQNEKADKNRPSKPVADTDESDYDTDSTMEEVKTSSYGLSSMGREKSPRQVPPPISDRAHSFPLPSAKKEESRKVSLPTESMSKNGATTRENPSKLELRSNDDMVENENETLRDRVSDLEKRVHDQNDEITCLRATLADALRRINTLEAGKEHVQINHREVRLRRDPAEHGGSRIGTPGGRRPISASYHSSNHDTVGRRASYASNRDKTLLTTPSSALSRRPSNTIYQSTGSLHSDGLSSNSMSPAPSPSPTHRHHAHRSSTAPLRTPLHGQMMGPPVTPQQSQPPHRPLSGSMSNLSLSGSKKWGSNHDFRDQSPGPNTPIARRLHAGSLHSLRSPLGSQQSLVDRNFRHGTKDAVYNEEEGCLMMFIRGRPVTLYAPSALIDHYSLSKVSPAPSQKLKLEWVYGYRGRDARCNLYLLPTGEMVYFVAAVVVLFNAEEHSQRHYLGHTEDIKCLAVHPNKLLIATGQTTGHDRREGKPHIRVWNSVSLQTLHIVGIGDFERSVMCVSFSKADGGNLLVAVDEGSDHTMSVWDWSRGERGTKITETKCSTETVVAAEFHPLEGGVIVSVGKGHVNFWQLDNTSLTLSRKTGLFDQRDKPKYVTCMAFSYTGDVITGDSNGNIFIWGRGYNAVTKALRKVHDGPIFSICVMKDGSIVTGGGRDRKLIQFDSTYKRTGMEAELPEHLGSVRTISQGRGTQLLLGSTRNSILQGTFELSFQEIVTGHVDEVWALASHPQQNQFLSAGYDQHIHLWDTLTHRSVWSSHLGDQAQSACFSSLGEIIVVGMTSGKWMVIDSQTREVYAINQDGSEPIQTVNFSPNDKLLALGSRDNLIYIYQVGEGCRKFNRMGRCMGHSSYITHLDWSSDSSYLQSNSGDNELLFWNASICRQVSNASNLKDVSWATQTCILSFNTIGVWPETLDGTDLNTCAKSHNQKFLATGDDFGKIKLYSYPATQPKSLHHTVGGHSSHVTRIDFVPDDNRLISAGGRDTALMQWSLV